LQNIRGAEVWRAAQHINPQAGMTVGALMETKGKKLNTATEKEGMLRCQSFPPNDDMQLCQLPPMGSTHTCVTDQAVDRALYTMSVKKAPASEKLSFEAIQLL
jgi:hypothetical protein